MVVLERLVVCAAALLCLCVRVSSARVLSFRVCSQKASFGIRLDTKTRAPPFCELSLPLTKQPPHRRTRRCSGTAPAGRRARMAQTFPTAWSSNPVSIHCPDPQSLASNASLTTSRFCRVPEGRRGQIPPRAPHPRAGDGKLGSWTRPSISCRCWRLLI